MMKWRLLSVAAIIVLLSFISTITIVEAAVAVEESEAVVGNDHDDHPSNKSSNHSTKHIRGGNDNEHNNRREQQQQQQQQLEAVDDEYEEQDGEQDNNRRRKLYDRSRIGVDSNSLAGSGSSSVRQSTNTLLCGGACQEDSNQAVSREATFNSREEIFDQLNPKEYDSVIDYVTSDDAGDIADMKMRDVRSNNDAFNKNYVVFLQLFPPPKKEAIEYIDGLSDKKPDRYAIVTVHRGKQRPRDVMQYKVGPIVNNKVDDDKATIEKLLDDNEIPWSMRGNYGTLKRYVEDSIKDAAYELRDVFKATTGGYCYGDNSCRDDKGVERISYIEYGNLATTTTTRITNVHFIMRVPNRELGPSCLLPIPISFHVIENPNVAASQWKTTNFQYCYQGPYDSASALLRAIENGEVTKCTVPTNDIDWTSMDPITPSRSWGSNIKEPISFHSMGKRYVVDENRDGTGHRISWLGWTFHVSSDQMHGMVLRNLKFKDERLAYEISFQEYFASYSGMGGPGQTIYFDSNWEIGNYDTIELGLDCPEDALLLPLVQHASGADKAETKHNVMCIFEQPMGESMYRHRLSRDRRVAGIPRTMLKVRVVSVMGNYDYIPTLSLMADGVLKLEVDMGGYLQAGYSLDVPTEENPESPYFGTRLRNNMAGLLHDHIIGVKADLDIGGTTQNTLMAGKVKYGTYEEATKGEHSVPRWHTYNGVKYMDWTMIDNNNERGISAKDYDTIMIASANKKNEWDNPRSYELVFEHTVPHQVYPKDHPISPAIAWQNQNVAITRQNDSHRYCSFPSNYQIGKAFKSFDLNEFQKQSDNNVVNEDLVFWIMFGVQHYPKAEDIPVVSNFGSGFILKPRNMYDRAAYEDLPDNRNIEHPVCVPPSIFGN